jgi:hypothetical protein
VGDPVIKINEKRQKKYVYLFGMHGEEKQQNPKSVWNSNK